VYLVNDEVVQTKEPINNSLAVAFGLLSTGNIFSLKMVHMYWDMLKRLI